MNAYSLSKQSGVYRQLGESATVLRTLPDTLNHHFVCDFEKDSLTPVPTYRKLSQSAYQYGWTRAREKQASCIPLPQKMLFGTKAVKSVGMTTDGFLFFGDTVVPTFVEGDNSNTFYMAGQNSLDFVYFSLIDLNNGKYGNISILLSGNDTKIGYEVSGDTLFIAYENVVLQESGNESQIISWNYQINTATNSISLQTKGLYSGEKSYPARNMAYGLMGKKQSDDIWLSEFFTPKSESKGSVSFLTVAKDSLPDGTLFTFTAPEECRAIENPSIDWSYYSTHNEISLYGTSWDGADLNALFVLSQTEEVQATGKPIDGTDYYTGWAGAVKVGTDQVPGLFAYVGKSGSVIGLSSPFGTLEPEKEYWIHGYVYNPSCSNGPLYGTPVVQKIQTKMEAPEATGFILEQGALKSMKLTLPEPAAGRSYVVALSETSLGNGRVAYNLLQNGKAYETGDQVAGNAAEIIYSGVGAGEYPIENLSEGTLYRVSVWLSKGTENDIEYSAGYLELSGETRFIVPANISFNTYTVNETPGSWIFSEGSSYVITECDFDEAKVPQNGTKLLYTLTSYDGTSFPTVVRSSAISPIIEKGEAENISATFNMGFFISDAWSGAIEPGSFKNSDSVVISWATTQDAQQWNRLDAITRASQLDKGGFISFPIPPFSPTEGQFCFKIETFLSVTTPNDYLGMGIENIVLEESLPCKYPINITVPQETIGLHHATIKWEDGNADPANSFIIRYRAQNQEEWTHDTVDTEEITLTELENSTLYTVKIQAFCGEENGLSLERESSFSTRLGFPYSYDPNKETSVPEGSSQYRGRPGQNLTAIDLRSEAPQWTIAQDASETQNTVLVNYLDQNPNAWLVFPAINTDNAGLIKLDMNLSAWGFADQYTTTVQEAKKTSDSLWIFVSSTGNFSTDRHVVGFVEIDSLHYKVENDAVIYDSFSFEFEVEEEEKEYSIALYVQAPNANMMGFNEFTILAVRNVDMAYSTIFPPAVTNLTTSNLRKDSVTISWEGTADEYRLLWKELSSNADYDTVKTEKTSHTLSGLKPDTQYAYLVYGIYGGVNGRLSAVKTFTTLDDESGEEPDTVQMPVFDTPEGEVAEGKLIKITCATDGAKIYFTTDGKTPTDSSSAYVFGVAVTKTMTIKAIAVKDGMVNSKVAEATYTVNVANESDLLTEVKIYPNPTEGLFNVAVPAAATVEVFAANGTLVERLDVPAGETALRLNQAGMYFVKIIVNGQSAVKKLIVR